MRPIRLPVLIDPAHQALVTQAVATASVVTTLAHPSPPCPARVVTTLAHPSPPCPAPPPRPAARRCAVAGARGAA